jgi:hypothetical protein
MYCMLYRYYLDSAQAAVWKAEKTREIRSSASSADSPCSDRAGARYIATVRRCTKYSVRNRTALNHLISKPCETTIFFQLVRRCQLRLWLSLRGEYRKTVNGAQLLRETNFKAAGIANVVFAVISRTWKRAVNGQ